MLLKTLGVKDSGGLFYCGLREKEQRGGRRMRPCGKDNRNLCASSSLSSIAWSVPAHVTENREVKRNFANFQNFS
jgi:hypothetical protein